MTEQGNTALPWKVDADGNIRDAELMIVAVRHRLPKTMHLERAELIVAAVNERTSLHNELSALRAENEKLREALEKAREQVSYIALGKDASVNAFAKNAQKRGLEAFQILDRAGERK